MKECPNCRTQYTDDSLQFCLQDGSPLTEIGGSVPHFGETDTIISSRTRAQEALPTEVTARPQFQQPERSHSHALLTVLLSIIGTLFAVGIIGLGYWIYVRDREREDALFRPNTRQPVPAATATSEPKPSPSATPSPIPSPTITATPFDRAEVTSEITDAIDSWKTDTEEGNMDALSQSYGDTVDYFRSGNVSRDAIRRDKGRAFAEFDSIQIDISNVNVDIDDSGETATAQFDKHWLFDGERVSEGKVRSQLKFRKTNGKWLIVSERDLKIY